MAINLSTYPINQTDITDLFIWSNNEVGGIMALGFLVVFFIVSVTTMKAFETKKPFAASMFGTVIVASLLWALELLEFKYVGLVIIMAGFSLLWLMWERD